MFQILSRFKKALRDPDRKPLYKIIFEYVYYKFVKPGLAEQYFNKYLYRRQVKNIRDFIFTHKLAKYCWELNDPNYSSLLFQKYHSEIFFAHHNIPFAKSIAYNFNSLFYIGQELIQANTVQDFEKFLQQLKTKGLWTGGSIIVKPRDDSWGGKGVFKIFSNDLINNPRKIADIFQLILKSGYLFQNTINQHPLLNELYPGSINTLRVDTFTDRSGKTNIFSTFLRIGTGNSVVDNISRGGLFVGVDIITGILLKDAFSDFDSGPAKVYNHHPMTSKTFEGFSIPFFQDAKILAMEAANKLPQVKVIGWDVAIQPEGPILIEGNCWPALHYAEIAQGGFAKNRVVGKMLSEVMALRKNNK